MAKILTKDAKYTTADGHVYLTKKTLLRKARSAGKKAAFNAMQVMGFVVVAQGSQIVKKYANGNVEVIGQIEP